MKQINLSGKYGMIIVRPYSVRWYRGSSLAAGLDLESHGRLERHISVGVCTGFPESIY